jgi:hypothetical protein
MWEGWIGTLEPEWFDWVYMIVLTVCAGLLLLTTWGYFRVWRRLRRGLQALDLHPSASPSRGFLP